MRKICCDIRDSLWTSFTQSNDPGHGQLNTQVARYTGLDGYASSKTKLIAAATCCDNLAKSPSLSLPFLNHFGTDIKSIYYLANLYAVVLLLPQHGFSHDLTSILDASARDHASSFALSPLVPPLQSQHTTTEPLIYSRTSHKRVQTANPSSTAASTSQKTIRNPSTDPLENPHFHWRRALRRG
jgi:hypothetical protein